MLTVPDPGFGQWRAQRELDAVEALTEGGVQIGRIHEPNGDDVDLVIELLIDCTERPPMSAAGVELLDTERVLVRIPSDYPLRPPRATITHDRFASLPHVVWNSWICLYLADNDWDPGHGMFGFTERLLTWFEQVADGSISGVDVPWDPPITASSWRDGLVVVTPDVPDVLESATAAWSATAVLEAVGASRFVLRQWIPGDLQEAAATTDGLLVPVVGLPKPVAFSYPRQLGPLLDGVKAQQDSATGRLLAEAVASTCDGRRGVDPDRILPLVLLVSPAPSYTEGSRTAHIAAWWVDTVGIAGADRNTPLSWMTVYDQRPRTTIRRDDSRPASWLAGKRVLLLGCGGIGAPVAEFCARSGAAHLDLVDIGQVHPGILVRQPFVLDDIGYPKVDVLAKRLARIAEHLEVRAHYDDAIDLLTQRPEILHTDLVIDATASAGVAAALELIRWSRSGPKSPLLSLIVGHRCDLAVATLSLPTATGGGADVLRRLAVTATTDTSLHDLLDDLLPDPPRTDAFMPEPGCSDPTYIGSAADLASFAGQLLNQALVILRADRHTATPSSWAAIVRSPGDADTGAPTQRLHWPPDLVLTDPDHGYQIRLDNSAVTAIDREIARTAQSANPHAETGGLLLGQIDHASRVVWINEAHEPPPGSDQQTGSLALHLEDTHHVVEQRLHESRRLVGLVGLWHTHPDGPTGASVVDQAAMDDIVALRHIPTLLLIVSSTGCRHDGDTKGVPSWWARLHFP